MKIRTWSPRSARRRDGLLELALIRVGVFQVTRFEKPLH